MNQIFYPLVVSKTSVEISGFAKTVMFEIPADLSDTFTWRAGQHISIRFIINQQEVRRSYSISSSPASNDPMQVTVKRVPGGLVSNYINDSMRNGDTVDVMPPFGSFCLHTAPEARRTHYFFGAGSGITPLYSMITSVLYNEPHSVVHLIYGNKSTDSILFENKLVTLTEIYGKRINVLHVLSAPSIWKPSKHWRQGKIDAPAIEAFITEFPPYAQDTQYYICGPGTMNQSVKAALLSLDVPPNRIHMENYGATTAADNSVESIDASANIILNGKTYRIAIAHNESVLDAVRKAGLNPPYSCQSGVCGACRGKLAYGTVHMRARIALEDSEIENGHILTCQSLATSETLSVSYD